MAAVVSGAKQLHLKLRVRVADASTRCKVEVPAACTLRELKAVVAAHLGISDVNVSLNKKVRTSRPLLSLEIPFLIWHGHSPRCTEACLFNSPRGVGVSIVKHALQRGPFVTTTV